MSAALRARARCQSTLVHQCETPTLPVLEGAASIAPNIGVRDANPQEQVFFVPASHLPWLTIQSELNERRRPEVRSARFQGELDTRSGIRSDPSSHTRTP
jgi:hypothetical protein